MGRPAGSKNKPKTFKFNHTNDANQFSITKEAYDREVHKGKDRKSTRLNSSHIPLSRMPSSA